MIAEKELRSSLELCKAASRKLRPLPTDTKNRVLRRLADGLVSGQSKVTAANALDLEKFDQSSESSNRAFRDRLSLNPERIEEMSVGVRQIADLADPVGEIIDKKVLKNGLELKRVRSPLGLIFMIFESRPNVAIEAFALAFKSGNVIILRGGKESMQTVSAFYAIIRRSLLDEGVDPNSVWGIEDPDRAITAFLLSQKSSIDVVVPRGGQTLIDFVAKTSQIPIIKHDRGMCHVYVHEDADLAMAKAIAVNSKTQRPGVCNAMETLIVNRKIARELIPDLYESMKSFGLQWFGCPETETLLKGRDGVHAATETSWDTEYLDYKMNCRIVGSLDEAIAHIERHGSKHSESIVTQNETSARRFQEEIDAAVVYWNASTRFTDGFEFGLGGELGISTQKLHVRGPVGLRELTSARWIGDGSGQIKK
jgi:glutamate-5-semialdehyde dehydrogenase